MSLHFIPNLRPRIHLALATLLWALFLGSVLRPDAVLGQTQIINPPNQPLNRQGFKLTFSDEFNGRLDLANGGGTSWQGGQKWYCNLPFPATVGEAKFVASNASTLNGYLLLRATKSGATWTSALLSSLFPTGAGFSQKYGYFEARIQMPEGLGTWPQFWLFGPGLNYDKDGHERKVTAEIDIMEDYGVDRSLVHQNYHHHTPLPNGDWSDKSVETTYRLTSNPGGFHTYGVLIKPDFITWYVDDRAIRKLGTPAAAKEPLSVILSYAVGGGYKPTGVKNPSYLYVDYLRVYQVPLP